MTSSWPGTIVVVDVANVLGSRPDGWWRDREGAATRLMQRLAWLPGSEVSAPDGGTVLVTRLIAVLEGAARTAATPDDDDAVEVVRADRDGDSTIVELARQRSAGAGMLVVTADRGLRQRLPDDVRVAGPNWLNALIGR